MPINRLAVCLLSLAAVFNAQAASADAKGLSLFGVTFSHVFHRLDEESDAEGWVVPTTHFFTDVETVGSSVYLAVFGGPIQEYSRDGKFLRTLVDLTSVAGRSPNSQMLNSDLSGNLYSAFSGSASQPRTSFRLDRDGNILATYSHADLVFPRGVSASSNGEVYIANSFGGGIQRLYRFASNGDFLASYPLTSPMKSVSDLAINEARNIVYMTHEFVPEVYVFNLIDGAPVYSHSLPGVAGMRKLSVEPISGRLFATHGPYIAEVALDGSGATDIDVFSSSILVAVDVVAIPEPTAISILIAAIAWLSLLRPSAVRNQ